MHVGSMRTDHMYDGHAVAAGDAVERRDVVVSRAEHLNYLRLGDTCRTQVRGAAGTALLSLTQRAVGDPRIASAALAGRISWR